MDFLRTFSYILMYFDYIDMPYNSFLSFPPTLAAPFFFLEVPFHCHDLSLCPSSLFPSSPFLSCDFEFHKCCYKSMGEDCLQEHGHLTSG